MSKRKPSILNLQNFQKKKAGQEDFYIRTFLEHKNEHPFISEAHSHDFYMVMLFTKGSGSHTIDNEIFSIKPGSVFFMSPGQFHSWNLSEDTNGFVLFFNASFYRMKRDKNFPDCMSFLSGENKLTYGILSKGQTKEAVGLIEIIQKESHLSSTFRTEILRSLTEALIFKLVNFIKKESNSNRNKTSLIPKLEELIEKNFKTHSPVLFYAQNLNTTVQRLNLQTMTYLNKSVKEMITDRLIAEAKRLLIYSELTIAEIAWDLNFKDDSYFIKFFKRHEHVTPEEFRKKY
jgi:AraC-like DNA-binding protein